MKRSTSATPGRPDAIAGRGFSFDARMYALLVAVAIAAGLSLRAPLLWSGAASDDFMQYAMLDGVFPSERARWDLFNFADGSVEDNQPLMDYGTLPWWTAPGLRLAMLRPLSSALVWLDVGLFPENMVLRHIHSFVWWGVLVVLVACLLAQCLPLPVAAVAVLLFVLEEGHNLPIGWLAHRGAMVALCFGLVGLLLHMRARRRGARWAYPASALAFAIALLSGEWTFPVFGYLIAFELLEAPGSWWTRFRALVPAGLLGLSFLVVRGTLGYGASQSGIYIDPVGDPGLFAVEALQRIPVFFADLVYSVPSDRFNFGTPWRDVILSFGVIPPEVWRVLPGHRFWHVVLGVTAIGVFVVVMHWVAKLVVPATRRQLRWLLLGGLISMLPVLASFATSRLLVPMSIGFCACVAAGVVEAVRRLVNARSLRPRELAGSALLMLGVAHFSVFETARSDLEEVTFMSALYGAIRQWWRTADLDDAKLSQQRLILLSTMEHTTAMFGPFVLHHQGRPVPRSSWLLNGTLHSCELRRVAPNAIELTVLGGTLLSNGMEYLYRAPQLRMTKGHRVELDGMRVEVLSVLRGRPVRVRFTFDRSLEDPEYVFIETTAGGLRRFRPPELGQSLRFHRAAFPYRLQLDIYQEYYDRHVSCFGERPSLNECRVGFGSADCGGVGSPAFACSPAGDCRWFAHGCAALHYLPSTCAPESVCCELGGTWPFFIEDTRRGAVQDAAHRTLQAFGKVGWDTEIGRVLPLELDESLEPTQPRVMCDGVVGGACGYPELSFLGPFPSSVAFALTSKGSDWVLTVEAVRAPDGELRARICRVAAPDHRARACDPATPPMCAEVGGLTLRELPRDAVYSGLPQAARLWARFPDGAAVDAAF